MALPKVAKYIQNVGKSIVYASVENLKEDMPTIKAIAEHSDNQEVYKAIYSGIRDYKTTFRRAVEATKGTAIYKAADLGIKAAIEDAKTGNWFNVERAKKMEEAMIGSMDFDDEDFDFGDMEDDEGSIKIKGDITTGDKVIAAKTEISAMKNAEVVSRAVLGGSQAQIRATEAATSLLFSQNAKLFGELRTDITNLSTKGIQEAAKSNQLLENIASNNQKFYEEMTKNIREMNALLKESTEMQRNMYGQAQKDQKSNNRITTDDIITSEGVLDLKSYGNLIKRNAKGVLSEKTGGISDSMFMNFDMGGESKSVLEMFATNPWGVAMQGVLRGITSKSLTNAMKNLDKTISGVGSTFLARMNNLARDEDNPLGNLIGSIFGIKNPSKTSLDPSKFEKGPVPFDGITRATINNAIPTYLARIEAALTGNPVRIYDAKSGRWTTARGLKQDIENMHRQAINSGTSDLASELTKLVLRNKDYRYGSSYEKKQIEDSLKAFIENIYSRDGDFKLNSFEDHFDYGVASEDHFKIITGALREIEKSTRIGAAQQVFDAKLSHSRRMQQLEESGAAHTALYSGAFDSDDLKERTEKDIKAGKFKGMPGKIFDITDDKGHNVFYYLQRIYDETFRIRNGIGAPGGISPGVGTYGTGKQFRQLDSPIEDIRVKTISKEQRDSERYATELEEFLAKGGKTFDLSDGNSVRNIIRNMSEEEKAEFKRKLDNSGNVVQRALYMEHFTEEEINAKREKKGLEALEGKFGERFRKATINEKMQMIMNKINKLTSKPNEWMTKAVEKAEDQIYMMLYGKEDGKVDENGKPIKGMMGHMMFKFNNMLNSMSSKFDEKIGEPLKKKLGIEEWSDILEKTGIKNFFDGITEQFLGTKGEDGKWHGGMITNFLDETKTALKEKTIAGLDWIGDAFSTATAPVRDKFKAWTSNTSGESELDLSLIEEGSSIIMASANNGSVIPITIGRDLYNSIKQKKAKEDYNKGLLMTVKNIVSKFSPWPKVLIEMQSDKSINFAFSADYLSKISVKNINDLLGKITKYIYELDARNYVIIDSNDGIEERNRKLRAFNTAQGESLRLIEDFVKHSLKWEKERFQRIAVEVAEYEKKLAQKSSTLIQDGVKTEAAEARLAEFRAKKASGAYDPDRFTTSDSMYGRFAGKTIIDVSESNSILKTRTHISKDDEAKYDLIDKNAVKYAKLFGLDDKTTERMWWFLLAMYNNGKTDIDGLLATELKNFCISFGYEDIGLAIDKTMTTKYANQDAYIRDLKSAGPNILGHASGIFDKATEVLERIYSLLRHALPNAAEEADMGEGATTIFTSSGFTREKTSEGSARESETEGDLGSYARGGFFKKRGLSALSKGELYERNGLIGRVPATGVYDVKAGTTIFPTGKDKAIELANEQQAIDKFITSNANADSAKTKVVDGKTYTLEKFKDGSYHYVRYEKGKAYILDESILQRTFDTAKSGIEQVGSAWKGSKVKINNNMSAKEIAGEIRKAAPEVTAGGALGGALGLLFGNPLLGAAVGASASYINSSDKAKQWLFGKEIRNENDEVIGRDDSGFISSDMQNAFKKYFPNISKHALVGGALGLLTPFGLVGGALLGGAAGFVKSNENAQVALFGTANDPDSGIISKNLRDKVKKMAPNLLIGGGLGLLAGPFGLVGNLLVGSALGAVSSTEEFKGMVLGEEVTIAGEKQRVGGLLGTIRDEVVHPLKNWGINFINTTEDFMKNKVLNPIAEAIVPISKEVGRAAKGAALLVPRLIDKIFESTFGKPLSAMMTDVIKPVRTLLGKTMGLAGTVARGTILAPVTAISALGNAARTAQIRRGDASEMSAADRVKYRETHERRGFMRGMFGNRFYDLTGKKDKFGEIDKKLATASKEELEQAIQIAKAAAASKGFLKADLGRKKAIISRITYAFFANREAKEIMKACLNGTFETARNLVLTLKPKDPTKFDKDAKKDLIDKITDYENDYLAADKAKKSGKHDRGADYASLKRLGFLGVNDKNIDNFYKSLTAESNRMKAAEAAKSEAELAMENDDKNTNAVVEAIGKVEEAIKENTKATVPEYKEPEEINEAKTKAQKKSKRQRREEKIRAAYRKQFAEENDKLIELRGVHGFTGQKSSKGIGLTEREYYDAEANSIRKFRRTMSGWVEVSGKQKADADKKEKLLFVERARNWANHFVKAEKDEENGEEKEPLIKRLFKGALGFIGGILGFGGKIALGATGIAAAGHGYNFVKDSLVPGLKSWWNDTASPWLKTNVSDKGNEILMGLYDWGNQLPDKIQNAFQGAMTWVSDNKDKVFKWYMDGFNALAGALGSVAEYLTANMGTIISTLGTKIIWPAAKGIFKGILSWWKRDEVPDLPDVADKNSKISNTTMDKMIDNANKSMSSWSTHTYEKIPYVDHFASIDTSEMAAKKQKAQELQKQFDNATSEEAKVKILEEANKNAETGIYYDENGKEIVYHDNSLMIKDKSGNTYSVDENGNIVNNTDISGSSGVVSRSLNAIARNALLNRKGLIGWGAKKLGGAFDAIGGSAFKTGVKEFASKKGILKTLTGVTTKPVGKTLKAFGNLWDDGIRKFANDTVDKFEIDKATNALSNNKTLNSIRENIVNLFKKLFDNKSVRDKAIDALEAAGKEITDESVEEMTKQIADKAANGLIRKIKDKILDGPYLGKILGKLNILSVVTTVADFLIGYKDAESIFGIISESGYVLTPMQRFFAGLANVAAGFLFLFSAEEILNVFIEWVLPLFNINNEDLKIAREKTTKLLTEINATGTDYDVKSYNNRNSIISKAKTAFNNLITSNKDAIAAATSIEGNKTVLDNAAKSINVSTSALTYGTGSGRAYMKDPRYAGLRFNKAGDTQYQTVGDSGCGPAAAVNAVNYAYGTGNDFTSAINMAKEYKEKNGGTHPDFFNKYFKKNGLSSTRLHGTSAIEDNIRKGNPTVLMGKDSKGGYNTPYGPNPHYVTAKGFDSKGNIIIDDPESANGSIAYNKNKVLNHTSVAESIDTKATISSKLSGLKPKRKYLSSNLSTNSVVRKNGRYGRGKYGRGIDTEWVKQTIWNFLRIKGYSEIATAGIMGNIAQECGFDYSLTERGNISNPGVGICQWTWSSRKKAFLAAVPDWTTNLEGQLNFMWNEINTSYKQVLPSNMNQCTDISSAVILFHNVYENSADEYPYTKRQNYAAEIFKQFTGTSAPVDFSSNPSTYDYSSTEYSVTSDTSSASEGIFDKIKNVFFSAFDYTDSQTGEKKNLLSLFGIGGGTSSYSSYSDQSSPISGYTTSISNTPAPKGLSTQQKNVYDLMSRLIGKNEYDQDRRERVDDTLNGASKGYGDCSSTVRYVLKTAAGVDPGSYTGAQITSDKGVYVDGPYEFGQKAMPNANNLAVGDLMFYGKDSSSNPKKVSHVEMYWGDGKRIGHGSGIGPRISDYAAMSSSQQYLGSKRFIPVGATAPSADGLVTTNMDPYRQISVGDTMYGAGSGNTQKPQYGTGASVDYSTLLKVIINILLEIADNSAKVDKIIEFLGNSGIISNDNVEALKAENRFPANKANMANKFKQAYGTGKSNFDDLLARGETSSIIQAMSLIASQ